MKECRTWRKEQIPRMDNTTHIERKKMRWDLKPEQEIIPMH
jgi:hypothetical protein